MSKVPNQASKEIDEIFVTPAPDSKNFLEIFSQLNNGLSNAKWKEVKSKTGKQEELQILIDTALQLSNSKKAQLFRKNDNADDTLIAIWLSNILTCAKIKLIQGRVRAFTGLSPEDIRNIALMSTDEQSPKYLADFLAEHFGIILVMDRGFTGMKLDGLVTKLTGGNPLIGLSLRYARYNNFWFTLLHELSHIALHDDKLDAVIYDDFDEIDNSEIEVEANRLAADSIIPRYLFNKSPALRSSADIHIYTLAEQSQVHPVLVAGAMQHYTKNYRNFSGIVNSIDVRAILGVGQ